MGFTGCHITFRHTCENRTGVAYQELERRYYKTGSRKGMQWSQNPQEGLLAALIYNAIYFGTILDRVIRLYVRNVYSAFL
jgi:hypothetical protein